MAVTEVIYIERDNQNDLLLKANGVIQDISALTKVELVDKAGTVLVTSDPGGSDEDGPFDWETEGESGKLIMTLGAEFESKRTYKDVRLVIYDALNTNGIVWVDDLILTVK